MGGGIYMGSILYLVYVVFVACTILSYSFVRRRKRGSKPRPKLPPGSLGWPYIGDTLKLYSQDPNVFFAAKQKRYGDIFKIHILGYPCVMLANPEAAKFVLVTHAHLFKPTYPRSKEEIIGRSALFFHQGEYHTRLRKLVQKSLSPESSRKLIPQIETIAISALQSWASGQTIYTFQEMKKFSFDVGILSIFGDHLEKRYMKDLKEHYKMIDKGYNSFPTRVPGTAYHKALLARKRLRRIVKEIIEERKEKRLLERDLLGHLLDFKDEKGNPLSGDQIADNIIGVLFAAQDTTASVLTWLLKYLHDDRKLLEAVKAEHCIIYEANGGGKKHLTWEQTRSMPLTNNVILECLRVASIISFTFREAVADVDYKGYLIPKGWKVLPLFRSLHHNPEYFPEPQKFDPSRFESPPKPNTFMPFGNGVHSCPGNELAKLEIMVLVHHLVTNFSWKVMGSPVKVECRPFPVPQQGLPTKFWRKSLE